ncbi:hypothetical protein ADUPG1_013312 [Aduncisulcus paluster]|uniref:Uncharacterized protein n=1 Tax=Aduncisulcus paluster TaxID=2918883 RepID=A0ABQ5K2G9_9EUKA|nr:hypothetical protein ADUPG1_013312 [Aduncisulcus paluster]
MALVKKIPLYCSVKSREDSFHRREKFAPIVSRLISTESYLDENKELKEREKEYTLLELRILAYKKMGKYTMKRRPISHTMDYHSSPVNTTGRKEDTVSDSKTHKSLSKEMPQKISRADGSSSHPTKTKPDYSDNLIVQDVYSLFTKTPERTKQSASSRLAPISTTTAIRKDNISIPLANPPTASYSDETHMYQYTETFDEEIPEGREKERGTYRSQTHKIEHSSYESWLPTGRSRISAIHDNRKDESDCSFQIRADTCCIGDSTPLLQKQMGLDARPSVESTTFDGKTPTSTYKGYFPK